MCPQCRSLEIEVLELEGTGTVYSYSILHHPQHPAFEYPVLAALVDLDEGIRVVTNLVGLEKDQISIGMRVSVRFLEVQDGAKIPVFGPITRAAT